jgi:hypothetical protein
MRTLYDRVAPGSHHPWQRFGETVLWPKSRVVQFLLGALGTYQVARLNCKAHLSRGRVGLSAGGLHPHRKQKHSWNTWTEMIKGFTGAVLGEAEEMCCV